MLVMTLAFHTLLVALFAGLGPQPGAAPPSLDPAFAAAQAPTIDAVASLPAPCQDETALESEEEQDDDNPSDHLCPGTAAQTVSVATPEGGLGALLHRGAKPCARSLLRLCGRLTC